jgi:HAE1 family hydrophobic/amphiphilic exporter-1
VRSNTGQLVKSANLINVNEGTGPNMIARTDRSRSVNIYANLDGFSMGEAMERITLAAEKYVPDDPSWSTKWGGKTDLMEESFGYMFMALVIAMMMIYVILGSQFESFVHPFTVLMAVPLAIAGSFGFLLMTGMNLDIMAFIGIIMLITFDVCFVLIGQRANNTGRDFFFQSLQSIKPFSDSRFLFF